MYIDFIYNLNGISPIFDIIIEGTPIICSGCDNPVIIGKSISGTNLAFFFTLRHSVCKILFNFK